MVLWCVSRHPNRRRFSHLIPLLVLASCTLNDPPVIIDGRTAQPDSGAAGTAGAAGVGNAPAVDAGGTLVDAGGVIPVGPLPSGCITGETRACGPSTEVGNCALGTRVCTNGVWGDCVGAVMPEPRICGGADDKDCDGSPDDTVDTACECVPGATEPCETHPGLDAVGACKAGERLCEASVDGLSSHWGACAGSVGPAAADSCTVRGDDANCDAIPNTGCTCIEAEVVSCGTSDVGICRLGTTTCTDQRFGACVGAVLPATRRCAATADNDCDGRPDNTIDTACSCRVGAVQACSTHPEDGVGICRAGSRTCAASASGATSTFGACTGAVAPAARNCTSAADNNCDGRADNLIDTVCACEIGTTRACETHPGLDDIGSCRAGVQLCIAGPNNSTATYGECTNSVGPAAADTCAVRGNDADCDGLPNEGCGCITAEGNEGCSTNPAASVCSAGTCVACKVNADCRLVTGLQFCSAGLCVACTADLDCGAGSVCNPTTRACEAAATVVDRDAG